MGLHYFYGMEICIYVFKNHSINYFHTHLHLYEFSILQSAHVLGILMPILWMRNLRLIEFEEFPKVTQTMTEQAI